MCIWNRSFCYLLSNRYDEDTRNGISHLASLHFFLPPPIRTLPLPHSAPYISDKAVIMKLAGIDGDDWLYVWGSRRATVLWSHHIRHHKIFRSGRDTRPPGRGMSRLCVCVSREGSQPRDRGPPNGPHWHRTCGHRHDLSKVSTGIKTWCRDAEELHEAVHLFPVSVLIFLLKGYCHKSPRCWRHAASVSRVTCCHAAGNKIPHHSHNSSHIKTFQENIK